MTLEEQKNEFVSKFESLGSTYNINSLIDAFGVSSIIEDIKFPDKASIITIYIKSEQLQSSNNLKNLHVSVTYGRRAETGGVYVRDDSKIGSPIDLTSDDYFYNISDGKIIFKNEELSAKELINRIYNLHILPTKKLKGIGIRFNLYIWRILFVNFFLYLSKIFYYSLYIITGDKYSYSPVFNEEVINGITISSSIDSHVRTEPQIVKGKTIDFLGYEINIWPIVFYSVASLIFYVIFELNNIRPVIFVKILNNNFLTALYVVVSLWVIDILFPYFLRKLIKLNSKKSFDVKYKRLKI